MRKIIPLFSLLFIFASCKTKQRVVTSKKPRTYKTTINKPKPKVTIPTIDKPENNTVTVSSSLNRKIIQKALSYKGTKYKYGGTSKSGIDCSGLMFNSFKSEHIILPRTSLAQSQQGVAVSKKNIQEGDLVFFKTSRKNRINHVGLVVSNKSGTVKFIHASSSRGVMISSLKEGYWSNAYAKARRIITTNTGNDTQPSTVANTYTVKAGDTLYAIARKFKGVSANDIINFNKLASTNLKPGMLLKIP